MSLIYKKIPKIMAEVGAISKDGYNKHQSYSFRGIEQIYEAVHPVLIANGVFCVPQVIEVISNAHEGTNAQGQSKVSFHIILRVNHKFYAEDGSFIEVITTGEGLDTSDKAANKALSGAMKYAFIELLSIPTKDVEDSTYVADSETESPAVESFDKFRHTLKNAVPKGVNGNGKSTAKGL